MKRAGKIIGCALLAVLVLAGAGLGFLTLTEYTPEAVEAAELVIAPGSDGRRTLSEGQSLSLLSWNVGFGGLDKDADSFLDGGSGVRGESIGVVSNNINEIYNTVHLRPVEEQYDFVLYQEVDEDSTRSYGLDERVLLTALSDWAYAPNFLTAYVPYPIPPLGRVSSGLLTETSAYSTLRAERVSLPCPFSWPIRLVNLKRCLLVSYYAIEGSDRELVLINLHLEAYDDGEGRTAQLRQLCAFLEQEYQKGNYVIAGGDFNSLFPFTAERYPITTAELWQPGYLSEGDLPGGFRLVFDESTPTCRLLNAPYDPETAQHYVIDGFILSPNVGLESVETLDLGFVNSDHNPVELHVTLG